MAPHECLTASDETFGSTKRSKHMRIISLGRQACAVAGVIAITFPAPAAALRWSKARPLGDGALTSVACPTPAACFAGARSKIVFSRNAFSATSAWTSRRVVPAPAPSPFFTIPNSIVGISCPSTSFCGAVDYTQEVLTSTKPLASSGLYRQTTLPGAQHVSTISCPAADLCLVGDSGGDIASTTRPSAGASAWHLHHVDQATVPCSDSSQGPMVCQSAIDGMDCPSIRLCLAVDDAGQVFASTDPTAARPRWTATKVASPTPNPSLGGVYAQITCPSTTFCAVLEVTAGEILTSVAPASGRWRSSSLNDTTLTSISCASAHLCAAIDHRGDVLSSADPGRRRPTWTRQHIDRARTPRFDSLTGIACPTARECVAVDGSGNVLIGR